MASRIIRTSRYVRSWITGQADLVEEEVTLMRGETPVLATVVRPARSKGPVPGWVVLHGITRPGRSHAQLVRFTRAMAATGTAVVVPEVPEWMELDLAPALTIPTVRCGIDMLKADPGVVDGPYGLVGFSFGAPHAVSMTAHPSVRDDVLGAVGFGGYCDLDRTITFMMTGRHEYSGETHQHAPDPYGRWIVAANYLTSVAGFEDAGDVASALRRIAALAGDTGAPAWDPQYDPAKSEMREGIHPDRQALFDLFAPLTGVETDTDWGEELGLKLAAAARRVDPENDPVEALAEVTLPVHILHGRHDHLIPFTEGLRIREALSPESRSFATVTRLFGHSAQDPFPSPLQTVREVPVFLNALGRILTLV
jgi:dienelactone hydrolase